MELDGIDIFVEVVDAQSFTRAAERLGMPKTTVSAKIARLEERLGVTLIRRTTRKLNLTEAGERYYGHCAEALKIMAEAEGALSLATEEPAGKLRITAPADLAQALLAPVIQTYLDRYCGVSIDLVVSNEYVDLIAHKIDLAIRVGELADSSLIVRKFAQGKLSLWASASYLEAAGQPKSIDDLKQHRLVWLRTRRSSIDLIDADGRTVPISSPGWLDMDDLQTCQAFVEQGLGIGLLPEFARMHRPSADRLQRVLPGVETPAFPSVFAYPRQNFVPPTVRTFIDTALEVHRPVRPDQRLLSSSRSR